MGQRVNDMNKFLLPKDTSIDADESIKISDFKFDVRAGKNKLLCKKLFGVGYTAQMMGLRLNFTAYDNHVWVPQIDHGEKFKGRQIHVCVNCGSVIYNGQMISNIGG